MQRIIKNLGVVNINNHLYDYPTPKNINYFWSFGSLAGIMLMIQIISGLFLAMNYTPSIELAFFSADFITKNIPCGWLMRYTHSNGASFFFITIYFHIARSLYYKTYIYNIGAWISGIIILFLTMTTAFLGYILPWGQMSFWGATVITNLVTILPFGIELVEWLWGGFSVGNPTLHRFFSLHFILPFIVLILVCIHLYVLHNKTSMNLLGTSNTIDKLSFSGYLFNKDFFGFLFFMIFFLIFIFYFPNFLNHSDNFIEANALVTPMHIVPEWYFLPFYAILRSCPHKTAGIILMLLAIVWLLLPYIRYCQKKIIIKNFNLQKNSPIHKFICIFFIIIFNILMWIGSQSITETSSLINLITTVLYFITLSRVLLSL